MVKNASDAMEHIENRASQDDVFGEPLFDRQDFFNAKSAFISGFFSVMGSSAAAGLIACLVLVLTPGKGNARD